MEKETIIAALKQAIYQRRSTRSYTEQPVEDEILEEIIDAGRHAPSSMNSQGTHFIVITCPEKRAELRKVMTDLFATMTEKEGMAAPMLNSIRRAKEGAEVDVTYGAPVLIVTANKKSAPNAIVDCTCVLSNMMLTASAYELGNCWINQFHMLQSDPKLQEFFAGLGVSEDEAIFGSLAIGYTEKLETTPQPRKENGNPVTYIK